MAAATQAKGPSRDSPRAENEGRDKIDRSRSKRTVAFAPQRDAPLSYALSAAFAAWEGIGGHFVRAERVGGVLEVALVNSL
jgi:hypothetical protein